MPQHVIIIDVCGIVNESVAGCDFCVVWSDFGMEFEPLVGSIICKAAVSARFGVGIARWEWEVGEVDAETAHRLAGCNACNLRITIHISNNNVQIIA